ncbi:phosphate ABC transporter permease PstA [Anaplasmataceae bacterium AB001_6]|nr:phosphate ABC transporter permease PstA [Anaplasmataceae bacterium AB001_6]
MQEQYNIREKFARLVGSRYVTLSIIKRRRIDKTVKYFSLLIFSLSVLFITMILFASFFGSMKALSSYKIYVENSDEFKEFNREQIIQHLCNSIREDVPKFKNEDFNMIFNSDSIYEFKKGKEWLPTSTNLRQICIGNNVDSKNELHKIAERLKLLKRIKFSINFNALFKGDSINPQNAGILSSVIGSILTIIICLIVSVPIGISTGLYTEELMKHSPLRNILEVSINNLSATPSVIFGIMGFTVYLKTLGITRSSPIAGGLTLTFIILPIIIVATKQAAEVVPKNIKQGAIALGASPLQAVLHHTLPISLPGIITGILLGIARVLGEAAPLLLIGMAAFVTEIPINFNEPATVIPLQIYTWAFRPEQDYKDLTSLLILITIFLLATLNIAAQAMQNKFQRKYTAH